MKRIAIILTVFNRKNMTLLGLRQLHKVIENTNDIDVSVFMTDDGCTDGTAKAVEEEFPQIHIIQGDGNLYWSGGMRLAWDVASRKAIYDYYIWYNDDAVLFDNALQTLFNANKELGDDTIISGAFCNPSTGKTSYGGWSKSFDLIELNPLKYEPIYFMNGNLVLIPNKVFQKIGNIDKHFMHSLGDWDYSARALKAGFQVVLTKKFVGTTSRHDRPINTAYRKDLSIIKRLKSLYSPFSHPKVTWHFKKTHFGLISAIIAVLACHIFVMYPFVAKKNKVVN